MSHLGPISTRLAARGANDREALRERFHKVILSAGYTEEAARKILAEWFERYTQDVPRFIEMMASYERNEGDPE